MDRVDADRCCQNKKPQLRPNYCELFMFADHVLSKAYVRTDGTVCMRDHFREKPLGILLLTFVCIQVQ